MWDALFRIYEGYARPIQMLKIGAVYYAIMLVFTLAGGDEMVFNDLGVLMLLFDLSIGTIIAVAAWRSFKRYKEDPLALPMLCFVWFGGLGLMLFKH